MRELLTYKGFTCISSGEFDKWKDPNGNLAMLDASTGVMACLGVTEPFVIQKVFSMKSQNVLRHFSKYRQQRVSTYKS